MSVLGEAHQANASAGCGHNLTSWEQRMDQLYTYFYLVLFIPGLLLNTYALWILCTHISKKTKAVIFMINLALADLAHVLSLPLRIYYYFNHTWPFGRALCLLCFYLKFLNMYASIAFLVCISVQRCVFLLNPFCARRWRRRYDVLISAVVWVVVSLGCSPFILMRTGNSASPSATPESGALYSAYTKGPTPPTQTEVPLWNIGSSLSPSPLATPTPSGGGCFKDLPMRRLPLAVAVTMMTLGELFGFVLPLVAISYCSFRIVCSLLQRRGQQQTSSHDPLNSSTRPRIVSSSSAGQPDRQTQGEKHRALRMVLSCSALFLLCFAPYHINFLLYLMVSQGIVSHCALRLAVLQFHPLSLCLASLSCCLNPLLYYFLTAEFRLHLSKRTSSFSTSLLSSPRTSGSGHPARLGRVISMESNSSYRE